VAPDAAEGGAGGLLVSAGAFVSVLLVVALGPGGSMAGAGAGGGGGAAALVFSGLVFPGLGLLFPGLGFSGAEFDIVAMLFVLELDGFSDGCCPHPARAITAIRGMILAVFIAFSVG